jgi:hypothetical protein
MKKVNIKNSFTVLLPALLLFFACTGGGGSNRTGKNTNVRSIEIVSDDAESVITDKKECFIFTESADFNVVFRDSANNEITIKDVGNIVWTLDGAETECFSFLYSSSLSGSTGAGVTVQFYFEPPYDTEAELKASYAGLSKKVNLAAYD